MHFYGFNIDSYVSATRHLTLLEDLAYRRMLDRYYGDETPLQGSAADIARRIGMRDQVREVEVVLADFFVETESGWANDRADREIATYRKRVADASRAGKASGEQRRSVRTKRVRRPLNDRSTPVQPTPSDGMTTAQPEQCHSQESLPTRDSQIATGASGSVRAGVPEGPVPEQVAKLVAGAAGARRSTA